MGPTARREEAGCEQNRRVSSPLQHWPHQLRAQQPTLTRPWARAVLGKLLAVRSQVKQRGFSTDPGPRQELLPQCPRSEPGKDLGLWCDGTDGTGSMGSSAGRSLGSLRRLPPTGEWRDGSSYLSGACKVLSPLSAHLLSLILQVAPQAPDSTDRRPNVTSFQGPGYLPAVTAPESQISGERSA